jgi:hypothetical protein
MHKQVHRHSPPVALAVSLGITLMSPSVTAQAISFQAGISSSWGESSGTICTLTCGPGRSVTHEELAAPMGGATLTFRASGALRLETGLLLARKGWSVTTPTLQSTYLELPALVHVGYWPRTPGFGFSVGGGGAFDLGLRGGADSQVATLFDASIYATADGRSQWSLSIRMASGLNTIHTFHVHTVALLLGFSPAGAAP